MRPSSRVRLVFFFFLISRSVNANSTLRAKEKANQHKTPPLAEEDAPCLLPHNCCNLSLEGDELGSVGRTDTGAAVLDGVVGDGELAEVVANHVGLHKQTTRREDRRENSRAGTRQE